MGRVGTFADDRSQRYGVGGHRSGLGERWDMPHTKAGKDRWSSGGNRNRFDVIKNRDRASDE